MAGDIASLSYRDRVYFDSDTGVAGIEWPVGTPQLPSDVIADVITMCTARHLRTISVHGVLALAAAMEHYNFTGYEHYDIADLLSLGGQNVGGTHIEKLIVTGAQGTGLLTLTDCAINALTLFAGRMHYCSFYTSTCSFKNADYIDLIDCESIYGAVTITVNAPARGSIKNWRGNLTLSTQNGGVMFVRGFKGDLIIDTMTAGTLDIVMNGGTVTINVSCDTAGTINIYGNARVTDNHGVGITVNDYTKETQLDNIETSVGRALSTMDFWSNPQEEIQVPAIAATLVITPVVSVADLPGGATIVRAIAMFKFRMVENTHDGPNALDGATNPDTTQVIQVKETTAGDYIDAINFADDQFTFAELGREGGDVFIGQVDIQPQVDADGSYTFQWKMRKSDGDFIIFNDIQMGIRIWYSL